jgi:hypothetical protein
MGHGGRIAELRNTCNMLVGNPEIKIKAYSEY